MPAPSRQFPRQSQTRVNSARSVQWRSNIVSGYSEMPLTRVSIDRLPDEDSNCVNPG